MNNEAAAPGTSGADARAPRKCIAGAEVLRDSTVADIEPLDIWIEGTTVVALTAPGAAPPFAQPCERVDGRGLLAIPGLINGHSHSYSALIKGTCAGEPLDLFVLEAMARRAPRTPAMVRASGLLHALELLKRGVTAHIDHFRHGAIPTAEAMDAVLGAYRDIGIRAAVAPMYEDRPYLDSLPIDPAELPEAIRARFRDAKIPAPEAYFEMLGDVAARWRGKAGRLEVLLGVDGPQRCTDRLLELAGEFARRHAMGNHTHLLEAKTQALVAERFGGSLVERLDRFGLVNASSSFAHFVWGSDRDIELVAARGATVIHNPAGNLHLGSGVARVPYMLRAGVNVAIGTDGGSGMPMSMLEQAKFASLLSRVTEPDARDWLHTREAFRLASETGARVIGMQGRIGRIAPGMLADIALVDTGGIEWAPRNDVFNHLVMYESGHGVRTVLVGGDVVVRDGVSTRIDETALLAEVREVARGIERDNAPLLAAFDAEREAWRGPILGSIRLPAPVDRLMH